MRGILVPVLALVLAASLIAVAGAESAVGTESTRRAKISEREIDFGEIEEGGSKTLTVKIENLGDAKLEVKELSTISTYLLPTMKNKIVEPGASEEIEIKLDSTGMKPCRLVSYVLVKYAYVKPNDNDRKVRDLPVTCSATIIPARKPMLLLDPFVVDLGVVNPGEEVAKTVVVKNVGDAELEVEPVLYVDRGFKITRNLQKRKLPPPSDEDDQESQDLFMFSFKGDTPGKINSFIIIKSNSGGGSYSRLDVTGEVADKNISITGFEPMSRRTSAGEMEPREDMYRINFGNFYPPYKVKVTVLNGRNKGLSFVLDENLKSRPSSIMLDPEEPGKVVSLQLDIIIEEPPPKEPEETTTSEEGEEEKPGEGEETDEEKPQDAETPEGVEDETEVKPSDVEDGPESGVEEDGAGDTTPDEDGPEKPPVDENGEEGEGE